jgi:hypothetical protein
MRLEKPYILLRSLLERLSSLIVVFLEGMILIYSPNFYLINFSREYGYEQCG